MTIENYLQFVFQVSISVAFTGFCLAGVVVSVYYSWKMAESLIKKRSVYVGKLSHFFSFEQKPEKKKARA